MPTLNKQYALRLIKTGKAIVIKEEIIKGMYSTNTYVIIHRIDGLQPENLQCRYLKK